MVWNMTLGQERAEVSVFLISFTKLWQHRKFSHQVFILLLQYLPVFLSSLLTALGPPLGLIFGRVSGSDKYYPRYSQGLLRTSILWCSPSLRDWMRGPKQVIPDTKCGMDPIEEESIAADLVEFLKEFSLVNYHNLRGMV
jgi:hypothetical protein